MKLFIIRHGDPDYTIDSLTEKGRKEAALLAERLKNVKIDHFYVSPLGRAQATAKYTLVQHPHVRAAEAARRRGGGLWRSRPPRASPCPCRIRRTADGFR